MRKQEEGLTLIEVLATIIILTIVMLITFNILNEATKTHKNQIKENEELSQTTLLLKLVTKDARKTTLFEKSGANPVTFKFYRDTNNPPSNIFEAIYTFNGSEVIREATTWDATTKTEISKEVNIFENLQAFDIKDCKPNCQNPEDENYLTLSFQQGEEAFTTKITLRKENTR